MLNVNKPSLKIYVQLFSSFF